MKFELNPTLEETFPANWSLPQTAEGRAQTGHPEVTLDTIKDELRKKIAPRLDYKTAIPIIREPNLTGAYEVTKGFLSILSTAYSRHQKITISPHDLWYIVLTELNTIIANNKDALRPLFTSDPDNKIEILVPTTDFATIDLNLVENELRALVPVDLDIFIPNFTTLTASARYASVAAFAEGMSHYYSYMTFCCGIHTIELNGSVEDWAYIQERAVTITNMFGGVGVDVNEWMSRVALVAGKFIEAMVNNDSGPLSNIFTQSRIGSGGQLDIDGWFKDVYISPQKRLENNPVSWAKVPYKNTDTGRTFVGVHGCLLTRRDDAGFISGDYAEVVVETTNLDVTQLSKKELAWM